MKTTQDLLNLSTGTTKTVLMDVGLPKRKRLKVIVKGDTLKVCTFIHHNRASGGRDEFPFTPEGMQQLNDYTKFWFSKKNQPSTSTRGWVALENLMNQTWKR